MYVINELVTDGKNNIIRHLQTGLNHFKKGYQPRNNF